MLLCALSGTKCDIRSSTACPMGKDIYGYAQCGIYEDHEWGVVNARCDFCELHAQTWTNECQCASYGCASACSSFTQDQCGNDDLCVWIGCAADSSECTGTDQPTCPGSAQSRGMLYSIIYNIIRPLIGRSQRRSNPL